MQQQAKNTLVGKRYKLRNEDNNKLNMMITAAVIYISNDSNVMEVYKPVQFVNDGFKWFSYKQNKNLPNEVQNNKALPTFPELLDRNKRKHRKSNKAIFKKTKYYAQQQSY